MQSCRNPITGINGWHISLQLKWEYPHGPQGDALQATIIALEEMVVSSVWEAHTAQELNG